MLCSSSAVGIECAFLAEYNLLKSHIIASLQEVISGLQVNLMTHCALSNFFLFWGAGINTTELERDELCKPQSHVVRLEVLRTEKHCHFLCLASKGEMKKASSFCSY